MEINNSEVIFDKKKNANRYLITLLIGAVLFILLTLVYSFSAKMALNAKGGSSLEDENTYYSVLSIIQFLYQIPIAFFFIFMLKDDFKNDLKVFGKNPVKNVAIITIGMILCLVLTYAIGSVYEYFGITDTSNNQETIDFALTSGGKVFMAISVVLLAPFVEEVLFRMSLCLTLKYRFNVPAVVVIIISTLIFSFMHVTDIESIIFIFQYIPLALVIVLSYYFSKSIYVPLTIHFLNNLASVIIAFLTIGMGE